MPDVARTREPLETYTVEQVCRVLNVSDKTLYGLLECGALRGRKVGRRWIVTREALEEYLNGS